MGKEMLLTILTVAPIIVLGVYSLTPTTLSFNNPGANATSNGRSLSPIRQQSPASTTQGRQVLDEAAAKSEEDLGW